MTASVFDSPLYARLFPTAEAGRLFAHSAEIRAMLLVEGTLAKVQGEMGLIPQDSAFFIHRAAMEVQVDPAGLAEATGQNGVSVPALVAAFRAAMEAPAHAQYVHWGATSQDIMDTGLMLRLRQLLALAEDDLRAILRDLGQLASAHATLPMAARTWGQHATVTSFGAQVAEWGAPLADLLEELEDLRARALFVSLSGAAGTSGALGPRAAQVRVALAEGLNLRDPGRSWHTDRGPVLRIADWLVRTGTALGKLGEDLCAMGMSGIDEVRLEGGGASSTMPQKQNPVAPSALVALARQGHGLQAILQSGAMQRHQRDGAAWMTEWLTLPQLCLGAASGLQIARQIAPQIAPQEGAMRATVTGGQELIHAEALSFALAAFLPRPEAQAEVKRLCREAGESGAALSALVARDFPDLDREVLFDPARQMGLAPQIAWSFADRATDL
ncbi:3-carboxy-cis,cis-muconate cycloisomerase [Salinihabitans flavidus]|uniref:3-carboxy-cis,cis-muconate cycloisomerase n=1 Tax=Salinihabitans flavidus TaxID=569882 RepID=A0A1H8R774_9RHOB|nr:lyase family protein [Salinihabitans flavidus]SEO62186.1 3-carboxy-cis,cis-muconate cycloisomerase [Salinihabitans flavidus]